MLLRLTDMKTIALGSMIDGKTIVTLPLAPGRGYGLKDGKCAPYYCCNRFWFVHLTRTGKADRGLCYGCMQFHALEHHVKKLTKEQGNWFLIEKGGLVEWAFNPKKLQFEPLRGGKKIHS